MEDVQTPKIPCLDCETSIETAENSEIGDILVCENCGVELEIVNNNPIELDYLYVQK